MNQRPKGKSEAPALVKSWMAEHGYPRCELCSGDKWDVYHTPEHPCPKAAKTTGNTNLGENDGK